VTTSSRRGYPNKGGKLVFIKKNASSDGQAESLQTRCRCGDLGRVAAQRRPVAVAVSNEAMSFR
jgi:hypothetical protein